nr:AIR synthase-related protein [Candidatus Sigynarchaeota archaeon]
MARPDNQGTGLPPGKLHPRDLKSLVYRHLGAPSSSVTIGPGPGRDFNAVDLDGDGTRLLLMTTDPIYFNDIFGIEAGAWLAFQIILSDMITSGKYPQYGIFSLNLPITLTHDVFERIWTVFDSECKRLGITITSGHTGRYDGCNLPIIGSGTFLSVCNKHDVVHTGLVQAHDDIVLVNGPGLEAIASLMTVDDPAAMQFFSVDRARVALRYWNMLSFEPAFSTMASLAKNMGVNIPDVVHGMHDVAERGVLGAAFEFCEAARRGCDLVLGRWPFEDGIEQFWKHFFGDVESIWRASGQGVRLVAMKPAFTSKFLDACHGKQILAAKIGQFTNEGARKAFALEDITGTIDEDVSDPFWPVFKKITEQR